jgi:hypothetical protein
MLKQRRGEMVVGKVRFVVEVRRGAMVYDTARFGVVEMREQGVTDYDTARFVVVEMQDKMVYDKVQFVVVSAILVAIEVVDKVLDADSIVEE